MKENYVYMDWNVFKYIMNPREKNKESDLKMKELVASLSKYVFPYSEAHLVDLARGYKKEHDLVINKDLDSINDLTKGKVLGWQGEVMAIGSTDIKAFFYNDVLPKSLEKHIIKVDPTDIEFTADLLTLDPNHPMRLELESNNGVLDYSTFEKFNQRMVDNIFESKDIYKSFREYAQSMKIPYENLLPFADNDAIAKINYFFSCFDKDITYLRRNFIDIFDCFLILSNRKVDELILDEKIEIGYGILDFFSEFSEKLKGKNTLSNMVGDIKHLIFAKEATYFITEDSSSYEKAKFIYDVLNIKTKVCKIDEFVNKF